MKRSPFDLDSFGAPFAGNDGGFCNIHYELGFREWWIEREEIDQVYGSPVVNHGVSYFDDDLC